LPASLGLGNLSLVGVFYELPGEVPGLERNPKRIGNDNTYWDEHPGSISRLVALDTIANIALALD